LKLKANLFSSAAVVCLSSLALLGTLKAISSPELQLFVCLANTRKRLVELKASLFSVAAVCQANSLFALLDTLKATGVSSAELQLFVCLFV